MDEDEFRRPREVAQIALALLTASAHDDDDSRFAILEELRPDQAVAVLTAMCALVVGGWPVGCGLPISEWVTELGKRVVRVRETLPPAP